eukprot:m.174111 g.174111  ORF g.174111 m.174111 type:complete len:530 (-) comp31753_c0_seq1:392-1981(-)
MAVNRRQLLEIVFAVIVACVLFSKHITIQTLRKQLQENTAQKRILALETDLKACVRSTRENLEIQAKAEREKKPPCPFCAQCAPFTPCASHSTAVVTDSVSNKDDFYQVVYQTSRTSKTIPVLQNYTFPWNPNGQKVHLLSPRKVDVNNITPICKHVDVMFHQIGADRCALLLPDQNRQSGLFSVDMDSETNAPAVPSVRRDLRGSSFAWRNDIIVSFLQGWTDMVANITATVGTNTKEARAKLKQNPETMLVMCTNQGHFALVLNFFCGLRQAKIAFPRHMVFTTSTQLQQLLQDFGISSFYHTSLGEFHEDAAQEYGDSRFGMMMFMKQYSVQLALETGYDVLFQDVDVTWLSNPIPDLQARSQHFHVQFQNDGSCSKRFSPYCANSGFFYMANDLNVKKFWDHVTMSIPAHVTGNQEMVNQIMELHVRRNYFTVNILPELIYVSGKHLPLPSEHSPSPAAPETAKILHFSWTRNITYKLQKLHAFKQLFVSPECLLNFEKCVASVATDPQSKHTLEDICIGPDSKQ